MLLEGIEKSDAHGLAILFGISDIGENLGEGFYVVDAYKLLVLFQCFLLGIEVINFFWGVILEMFVVDDAAQWQAVALPGW